MTLLRNALYFANDVCPGQLKTTQVYSSPEAMLAHLRAEVRAFTGQAKARDDLTVVVLQV